MSSKTKSKTLEEYLKIKCPICGREDFKSQNGLKVHLSTVHEPYVYKHTDFIEKGEGVNFSTQGEYIYLSVKMRRALYYDIMHQVRKQNFDFDEVLFMFLTDLAKHGLNLESWELFKNLKEHIKQRQKSLQEDGLRYIE